MTGEEFIEATPEQIAEIVSMPCAMYEQRPFPFAWCETHDTTFPLGSVCKFYGKEGE